MTPKQARQMYARQIGAYVTIRRLGSPNVDASARARVTGFAPAELVGAIKQGDRKVILLAEDLETSDWPEPPIQGDRIILSDGTQLRVEWVDRDKRNISDTVIAYEMAARG